MKRAPSLALAIALSAASPMTSLAATQGTLGTTSSGTVNLSVTIPLMVQVSGLSDIALGSVSSFPATGSTPMCIYSNVASPLGAYYVTATSQNSSGSDFRVKDGGSNYISYNLYFNNSSAASQTTPLASGNKSSQQTGGNSTSLNCGGSANANLNVSFSAGQVVGATAGNYTDVVTILITPT